MSLSSDGALCRHACGPAETVQTALKECLEKMDKAGIKEDASAGASPPSASPSAFLLFALCAACPAASALCTVVVLTPPPPVGCLCFSLDSDSRP